MSARRAIFLVAPFIELILIWYVAGIIGWGWMLLILFAGVVAGFALLRAAGRNVWQVVTDPRRQGQTFTTVDPTTGEATTVYQPPSDSGSPERRQEDELKVRESGLLVTAAALLALPGLISDVIGLLLVIPPIRKALARRGQRRGEGNITVVRGETLSNDQQNPTTEPPERPSGGPTVISGEILPPPTDPQDN